MKKSAKIFTTVIAAGIIALSSCSNGVENIVPEGPGGTPNPRGKAECEKSLSISKSWGNVPQDCQCKYDPVKDNWYY